MLELSGDTVLVDRDYEVEQGFSSKDYDFRVMKKDDPTTDASRIRRLVSLRVLPALRDAETDLSRWNRSPLRTLLEDLDLAPVKLAAVAADIDVVANKLALEPEVDGLQKRLATRLHDLVGPRLPVEPTIGVASSRPDSLLRGLRLFIDATRTRSVADASLGASNVLYLGMLMEALAVRRAASAFVTTMLGVEEPEAHLHVGLQRRLFRHLLETEPSLLLTTHSPHIAAVAPLHSLLLLRTVGGKSVAATALQAGLDDWERRDISRYLDVTRAELLFARVVLLVEGVAEVFLLPAIAAAAGFDLDEYGIVIVNVAGTDFTPYVKLLGEDGLAIPYAILTDGDPLRKGNSPEQGLARAAKLLSDGPAQTKVTEGVEKLIELEKAGDRDAGLDLRQSLQDICANHRIFVGDETLEIDVLPLVGNELISAYSDLATSAVRAANMARDVRILIAEDGLESLVDENATALLKKATMEKKEVTSAQRIDRVLGRIEAVGKGRLAQRLADHVTEIDMRERVLQLVDALEVDVEPDDDGGEAIDAELPGAAGTSRACLRILDWASTITREHPLFAADW